MELLNKSMNSLYGTIKLAGDCYKDCAHFYSRVFRGCILSCNMVGIGKSKYLTYPRKVYLIKLYLTHPKKNLRLMKRNFLENTRFVITNIK